VSIVSHGHGDSIEGLLEQLCRFHGGHIQHVVLIHNVPSDAVAEPEGGWPFRVTELFNTEQSGFGANHNLAFSHCTTEYFCVLNPDIELSDATIWEKLLERLREPMVGCAYPLLFNPDGSRQENERELVTPWALLRRHLLKLPQRRVDWVSGAFWMVRAVAWRSLGGFDERFYMYCEDVDFCLRLQVAGWKLAAADVAVTHDASWGSRSPGRHMAWHLRSLLRLWAGPAIRQYQARLAPLKPRGT
jgi:GT2 family glycosyltransferase